MKPAEHESARNLARCFIAAYEGLAQGRLEGRQEGRAMLIQRQLAVRFGPLPPAVAQAVGAAAIGELDAIGDRLLTASSLTAALGSLELREAERPEQERAIFRRQREQARTEGRLEGRLEFAVRLLELRFGPVPASLRARLWALATEEVAAVSERLLTAQSLEEALDPR